MKAKTLIPDAFALGLTALGLIFLFAPLTRMTGVITLAAALAYWLVMVVVRTTATRR